MNVLFCTFHPLFQRHFATDLELIQHHLDKGDNVTILVCNADLLACDTNLEHDPFRCQLCIQTRNVGLSLLSGTWSEYPFAKFLSPQNRQELAQTQPVFQTMQEVLDYQIENFDIGTAVMSSIIGQFLIATIDPIKNADNIRRFTLSALGVYRSVQNYLRKHNTDKVYIFNGRMSSVRAVLRACEQQNIPFTIHESGHSESTYSLFDNNMPHSIKFITECLEKSWGATHDIAECRSIGESWFQRRAGGAMVNGYSFVQGQVQGALPTQWDEHKRNIVIFTSSDYEFIAVGQEWDHPIYLHQLDGLQRIIGALEHLRETVHITIRIHPNHTGLPEELEALESLRSGFVTVISPKEKVSSYTLMQKAEKVITFGSTAGIEAAFWGTPSILGGKALYQNLGAVYTPQTHEELISLILNKQLPALPNEGTLKYAYFFSTFGQPFKYYQAQTFFGGIFKGGVPFANKWLFRLHTLYRRTVPNVVRQSINKSFSRKSLNRLTKQQ